jgi:hypothetical protein
MKLMTNKHAREENINKAKIDKIIIPWRCLKRNRNGRI